MKFVDKFMKELLEASPVEVAEKLHSAGKKTVGKIVLTQLKQEGFSDKDITLVREELKKLKVASDKLSGVVKGLTGPKQRIEIIDKEIIPELKKITAIYRTLNSVHSVKNSRLRTTDSKNVQTAKDDRKHGTSYEGREFLIAKRKDLIRDAEYITKEIEALKEIEDLNTEIETVSGKDKISLINKRRLLKKKYKIETNNVKGLIFKATSKGIQLASSVAAEVTERKVRKGTRTKAEFNSISKEGVDQTDTIKNSKTVGMMKSGFGKNDSIEVDADKVANVKNILKDMIASLSDYSDPLNGISELNKALKLRIYYLQGAQGKVPNDRRNTKRLSLYKKALETLSVNNINYGILRKALEPIKADLEAVGKRSRSDKNTGIKVVVKDPSNATAVKDSRIKRAEADKKRMATATDSLNKTENKEKQETVTAGSAVEEYIKNAKKQESKVSGFLKDLSSKTISDEEIKKDSTKAKEIIAKYKTNEDIFNNLKKTKMLIEKRQNEVLSNKEENLLLSLVEAQGFENPDFNLYDFNKVVTDAKLTHSLTLKENIKWERLIK